MNTAMTTTLPMVQRHTGTPFDRFFNEFVNRSWNDGRGETLGSYKPAVDAYETAEGLHFVMDVPGLSKDDLDLSFENGVLTIAGERKPAWEPKGMTLHRNERFHGQFSRSFSLPQGVDLDKIEAKFENGVLWIHVPKGEQLRAKKVDIQ